MENPFELLDQRLTIMEEKLDGIIQRLDSPKESTAMSSSWITTKQLAQHLGISTAAITNLRGKKIPYYKIGGRILFKKEEIDEFIENTRHKSGGEYLNEHLHRNH